MHILGKFSAVVMRWHCRDVILSVIMPAAFDLYQYGRAAFSYSGRRLVRVFVQSTARIYHAGYDA